MPNEILNIQHTITQLQNVEKIQAVGQQREQYQQKQEATHLEAKRELEQTIVQISEEAEKVLLNEEKQRKDKGTGEKRDGEAKKEGDAELKVEDKGTVERKVDIIV